MTPAQALVAVTLLLASAPRADDVSFHPKAGSEVKKKLEVELEIKPDHLQFTVNGEEMPEGSVDGLDESALVNLVVGVTEKYVEAKDGRPTDLLRTFDDLSLTAKAGAEPKEDAPNFDRLEGKTVRFHWKEDGEIYERSFHESEGDDVLLLNLSDDMDLRALLPGKNVSEGDAWDVPGSKLLPIFLPGGLPGQISPDEGGPALQTALDEIQVELAKLVGDAKLACKYHGSRDEDGARVADIRFTLNGKGPLDLSKVFESMMADEEVTPQVDATANVELEGEGELLWDVAAGRVHEFTMHLDTQVGLDVKAEADVEGETFKFAIDGKLTGKGTWKLAATAP
jgi:hypothetical protein